MEAPKYRTKTTKICTPLTVYMSLINDGIVVRNQIELKMFR